MIILGIDPGSITTGYAFLKEVESGLLALEYGVLHAPPTNALEDRLLHILTKLEELLDRYHPDALSMEGVFFQKNVHSALVLGHIRGAILVACRKRGMTYNEYSPRLVKQTVTGDGSASKEQVASMIFSILGIKCDDLPLDASDALAIAWTHANPSPIKKALSNSGSPLNLASRKRKVTKKQWADLIEKMGGTI
ncbi:MAG: crossover junction endodeoxyribonuclease RuvC [Fibrobacter sp.]|nr:crossover junction endodeoxyribonuclease RuvC [Fibrobacter sp.]